MTSRQTGHLFFEPRTYDYVNQATHEYKEEIKVGYNLKRKIVLLAIWAASPVLLLIEPTVFGLWTAPNGYWEFARHVGYMWFAVGIGGLLFRTVQLFIIKDVPTGLVWATKIVTDPFHDIKLYHAAPIALLRRSVAELDLDGESYHEAHRITEKLLQGGFAPWTPTRGQSSSGHLTIRFAKDDCPLAGSGQSPARLPAESGGDQFAKDAALDRAVGEGALPPPAVFAHGFAGGDEAVQHGLEIGIGVVQAEDQAPRADPAQRYAFCAQVVLQHPVIARRLGVADRPDGGDVGDFHRQVRLAQAGVEAGRCDRSSVRRGRS